MDRNAYREVTILGEKGIARRYDFLGLNLLYFKWKKIVNCGSIGISNIVQSYILIHVYFLCFKQLCRY